MAIVDAAKEEYLLAEIDGRLVFFTNMCLDRGTVSEGPSCYDVRDSINLDGSMAEVKPFVGVNHWGTILSKELFPLDERGSYCPEEWGYLDKSMSLAEFQDAMPVQLAAFRQSPPTCPGMIME